MENGSSCSGSRSLVFGCRRPFRRHPSTRAAGRRRPAFQGCRRSPCLRLSRRRRLFSAHLLRWRHVRMGSLPPPSAIAPADSSVTAGGSTVDYKLLPGSMPIAGQTEKATALPPTGNVGQQPGRLRAEWQKRRIGGCVFFVSSCVVGFEPNRIFPKLVLILFDLILMFHRIVRL